MAKLTWTPPKIPNSTATYRWRVPYAAATHNGATLRNGGTIEPRPWTEYARENLIDIEATLADSFKRSDDLEKAFEATAIAYNRAMQEAIASPVWNWPRTTRRKNGRTVGSPRDIVDTGELLDSQQLEFER